jgi:hypothetical protein
VYHVQGFGLSGLAEHAEGLDEDDGSDLGRFFLREDGSCTRSSGDRREGGGDQINQVLSRCESVS